MGKHADEPLCTNIHCREDRFDMIESVEHRTHIEYCCKNCGRHWKVPKPRDGEG